jgi:N-acetylglucosaminyl-diphospho-decaprenol L-rhamnosyltransferase
VFLDVDCIPAPALVGRYREAAGEVAQGVAGDPGAVAPWVLCGPVHYLPAAGPGGYRLDGLADLAGPHPARPAPPDGTLVLADDLRLFWSLSFATPARAWQQLGGFCEDYHGYGGEDTDFAMTLGASDGRMFWVGGATAYHQHHEVESPPTRHLAAIVRNANLFHDRWGWFPMLGWLDAFTEMGLAHLDTGSGTWRTGPTSSA